MIHRSFLLALLTLCLATPVWSKDTPAAAKSRLQHYLQQMDKLESRAQTIQPLHIPAASRTAAQDQEIQRRIEFLDNLYSQDVTALGKEITGYRDAPDSLSLQVQAVRDAWQALYDWIGTKLEYQNAGVNNPGLESLKKREPQAHQAYQQARDQARASLK